MQNLRYLCVGQGLVFGDRCSWPSVSHGKKCEVPLDAYQPVFGLPGDSRDEVVEKNIWLIAV